MKRLERHMLALMALVAVAVFSSCRNEDIDSGPFYGQWVLEEIYVDGVADTDYGHNITWAMMNDVIAIKTTSPYGSVTERWGTWTRTDGDKVLTLNFDRADTYDYQLPPEMRLPVRGVYPFEVLKLTSSRMELQTSVESTGETVRYSLFKN